MGGARASTGRSCKARDLAVDGLYDTDALRIALPWLIDHVEETWRVFGKDFWAYGLEPNRPTLRPIGSTCTSRVCRRAWSAPMSCSRPVWNKPWPPDIWGRRV